MSAKLLLGKPLAESICNTVKSHAEHIDGKLCLIGFDEPRWQQYAVSLSKSAANYGFVCENIVVGSGITADALRKLVTDVCVRSDVCGVMLQQPLDKQYKSAVECVDTGKDVDCLNPLSVCKLYNGEKGFRPATPLAVILLLNYYGIELTGKNVVVVGRGNAVGKPLALMLLERNATVTVCHTKTLDLPAICKNADIIVSACGVAGLITCDYVTERSIVIDVGLSFVNGKTCGDVDAAVYDKCAAVSPVPGGVGPVTRAALFINLLNAIEDFSDNIRIATQ
ncbi:MAG: bifunctional 5,10-methylenetetrahydrofolate dehydrogenase/5,10-methenyltetrahydrofolate cyclohydrolase [Corallococcus sp.]|nr:bifunctional 5,10-methylenetetrahydrofolate dehydrogenase/5,10-methenyltetrahydrofolate cyclohydrolase [Corallococcus sp.]